MVYLDVLTSAPLLPLITAYQAGVNLDVCILTRLGHSPPDGDLGPVHAVMAPWLDRVGLRFIHELCPSLVFSYALEYGRVDLLRELVATKMMHFSADSWTLRIGTWADCVCKHRHVQYHYANRWFVHDEGGRDTYRYRGMMYSNGASISGHMRHLAVAACLGGHVDLLRFAIESDDSPALSSLKPIALRAGRLCVVQDLFEKGVISKFKARDMRLAVATGRVDLVAFLLDSSSHGMVAEAFKQATTQCQIALLKWLCTTYNEPLYWRIALQVAVADLQHDVIAYFATTHNLHITPDEAARVHRRRKRHDEDAPTRQTRSRN